MIIFYLDVTLVDTGPMISSIPVAKREYLLEVIDLERRLLREIHLFTPAVSKDRGRGKELQANQVCV